VDEGEESDGDEVVLLELVPDAVLVSEDFPEVDLVVPEREPRLVLDSTNLIPQKRYLSCLIIPPWRSTRSKMHSAMTNSEETSKIDAGITEKATVYLLEAVVLSGNP